MFSDTDLHRLHIKCCDKSVIISITSCTQISFGTSKNNYITFGTYGSSRIHIPDHYNTCIRFQTLSGAKCSTVELSISLSSLINQHNGEERVKRIFRDQLAELAGLLEVGISLLVVVALMLAVVPLIKMLPGLLVDTNEVEISLFLQRALDIVIGIEFIKMLAKHSPGSALEVLLYAIARHMIVGHESAVEKFISVASIALIFFVRKFLFVPAFGATMPGGRKAPDIEKMEQQDTAGESEE